MDRIRTPAIIDIEASGFGKGSYPIEIGVVADDGKSYSWLVCPEPEWTHWQEEAEKLHKIRREDIQANGLKPVFIAEQLNELFEGQTLYTDGWGVDSVWLSLLFYVARRSMFFKLETLPKVLSEYQLEHWDKMKSELRAKHGWVNHRAEHDAKLLQLTFQKTSIDEQLN